MKKLIKLNLLVKKNKSLKIKLIAIKGVEYVVHSQNNMIIMIY